MALIKALLHPRRTFTEAQDKFLADLTERLENFELTFTIEGSEEF